MGLLEKIGYICLGIIALAYVGLMLFGISVAMPFGLLGWIGIVGVGVLLVKVIKERLANKEDDYYAKNVEK